MFPVKGQYKDEFNWNVQLVSGSTGIMCEIEVKNANWHEVWSQEEVYSWLQLEAQETAQEWADRKAQEKWLQEEYPLKKALRPEDN